MPLYACRVNAASNHGPMLSLLGHGPTSRQQYCRFGEDYLARVLTETADKISADREVVPGKLVIGIQCR